MNFVTIKKPLPNGRGFETIIFPSAGSPEELPPMRDFEDTRPFRKPGGLPLQFGDAFKNPRKVPRNRPAVRFSVDGVVAIMALALLAAVGIAGGLA